MKTKAQLFAMSLTVVLAAIGCGSGDSGQEKADTAASASILPAGESSVALGIFRWELRRAGIARGLDEGGNVLAEFRVHGDSRIVESVRPDPGFRSIDGSTDTITPRSAAYLTSFLADLKAKTGSIRSLASADDVVSKPVYGCYGYYEDCDYTGFYGVYYGWWSGYSCQSPSQSCGFGYWALIYW